VGVCFADGPETVTVQNQNKINPDDILAEFDGGVITRKDIDAKISKLPMNAQGRYKTIEGQKQVLDIIATEEVFNAKALQLKLDQDPDVRASIENGKKQFFVQEYYKRNISDLVVVTEQDKRDYYENNKQAFYVFPNVTINYIQAADEQSALDAIREIQAGKSWADASDLYNINNYAKGLKGTIKNIRLNGNIPGVGNDLDLERLIAESTPDSTAIHGPHKTTTGWHVFRIMDYQPGKQKTFEEVLPELDQRTRPGVETRMLNDLTTRLKEKYSVVLDTTRVAEIDLYNRANNSGIESVNLVSSTSPDINITVATLLDNFAKLSQQEQLFFSKGEGAKELLDQELIRALLYADAKALDYEQYLQNDDNYKQMQRFFLLNKAFRMLVVDSIQINSDETRAYYDEHIADYTTPANRSIQVLWFTDEAAANDALKDYTLYTKFNDEERINKLIENKSAKPKLALLENIYDNGIITGIGPDENFCNMVWDNPVGYISPVFTSARGDIVFFRTLSETPATAQSFTEIEPRIYGSLKNERQASQQEKVTQDLYTEFHMVKYPEKISLDLSAEDLFMMADDSAKQRNFKDAITFYDQIIKNYPNGSDDYRASFMKAFIIAEELKDEEQALQLFKDFLKKYPEGELNESAQFMIDSIEGNVTLDIEE
jgi:hypothetical protein